MKRRNNNEPVFDYTSSSFISAVSDTIAFINDGHMMIRMGDSFAMDTQTGEMHMISGWDDSSYSLFDDDDDEW